MSGTIKVGQLYGSKCSPMEFPIAFFKPHEARAYRNHWQSLERLAERGGLGLGEAVAILNDDDKPYRDCPENEAWIRREFEKWSRAASLRAKGAGGNEL